MKRIVSRRRFVALGALSALAGCAEVGGAIGSTCGSGRQAINEIKKDEDLSTDVQVRGEVLNVNFDSETNTGWFTIKDPSGVALVIPTEQWGERIRELEEDQCVVVDGRLEEIYEGKYTTCVDPGDSTCSWLTEDVKIGESTWERS